MKRLIVTVIALLALFSLISVYTPAAVRTSNHVNRPEQALFTP